MTFNRGGNISSKVGVNCSGGMFRQEGQTSRDRPANRSSGAQHGYRLEVIFNDNFLTCTDSGQEGSKAVGRFGFRNVDCAVSHALLYRL